MEIVYTPKAYLGFESPSLRQKIPNARQGRFVFKLMGADAIGFRTNTKSEWGICMGHLQMYLHGAVANALALRWPHRHTIEYLWKDGRAAECGGLENRFTGTPGNEGSNPSPSARVPNPFCLVKAGFLFDNSR